jgi:hypothetical protein
MVVGSGGRHQPMPTSADEPVATSAYITERMTRSKVECSRHQHQDFFDLIGWRQDDGVIGTCPPKSLKNAISGQGFGNFGLKNAKFGQGNGQISVSKTQFFGQPFGGAFRGLTQCASLHFTAYQPWNEIQAPHNPLPHSLQTAADDF